MGVETSFWSGWVIALVLINYVSILLLFLWAPTAEIPTDEDGTTGHAWSDGEIKEGMHKLPFWWLALSSAAFFAALVYVVLYPAFGASKGILGWTSVKEMEQHIVATNKNAKPLLEQINEQSVLELSKNQQAMKEGLRLFDDNCAACHGYDAKGQHILGAPNLTDNIWLHGGKVSDIIHTITHGRTGAMPAWGPSLGDDKVHQVANYVMTLSGEAPYDASQVEAGKVVFSQTCVACHGPEGHGNQLIGAPDLTDNDWIFGGDYYHIVTSVNHGRSGHMPAWENRLNSAQIKVLAAWVLSHNNDKEAVAANGQ